MPAETEKQRITAAIAKHAPEKLFKRNRGMLKMSKEELSKFASKVKGNKVNKKAKEHIKGAKCN